MSSASNYEPPLDGLFHWNRRFPDTEPAELVQSLGLTREHVPALVRMLEDESLWESESEWQVPYRACYALAGLRAIEAVPTILRCVDRYPKDYHFWYGELRELLEPMGWDLLSVLAEWLEGPEVRHHSVFTTLQILEWMMKKDPEKRAPSIAAVMRYLDRHLKRDQDDREVNGMAVDVLLDWHANEASDTIERAFKANAIDPTYCGQWPQVKEYLEEGEGESRTEDHSESDDGVSEEDEDSVSELEEMITALELEPVDGGMRTLPALGRSPDRKRPDPLKLSKKKKKPSR